MSRTSSTRIVAGLSALLAVLGLTTAMAGPVGAETAAPTATARILPYAGDSQVLVYGTRTFNKTLHNYFQVANKHVELHALTKSGKRIDLVNTGTAESVHVTVVGSVIAMNDPSIGGRVRVWDLADNETLATSIGPDDFLVGAAPDGFLYRESKNDGVHLYEEKLAGGVVTDLGVPLDPAIHYGFTPGPDGVIAFDADGNDTAGAEVPVYMKWSKPGKWVPLHRSNAGSCNDLGKTYAACNGMLPLDGAKQIPLTHLHCAGIMIVFHDALVRTCHDGKLRQNDKRDKFSRSRRVYADQSTVHAFNKLIVSSPTQSKLETLTSINAKPKILLTAT